MLVLSRTPGQRVFIGDEIIVTVLGTKNGQVRLGLEAPSHIRILREEVQSQAIPTKRKKASNPQAPNGLCWCI